MAKCTYCGNEADTGTRHVGGYTILDICNCDSEILEPIPTGEVITIQVSQEMKDMLIAIREQSMRESAMEVAKFRLVAQRLQEFKTAWWNLNEAWEALPDASEFGTEIYPFPHSFFEMAHAVSGWVDSFIEEIAPPQSESEVLKIGKGPAIFVTAEMHELHRKKEGSVKTGEVAFDWDTL